MAATAPKRSDLLNYVSLVGGVLFVGSGLMSILVLPTEVELYAQFGFPKWATLVVGAWEFGSGVLLLTANLRVFGAFGVAVLTVAAAITHVASNVMLSMLTVYAAFFVGAVYVLVGELRLPRHPGSRPHPR
jgi:uncharacterized membrane protein YphA (DoxX/SURF4 family)